eukprot:SAG11_NODE_11921_length_731_cov_1.219937_2_plen_70_part_00
MQLVHSHRFGDGLQQAAEAALTENLLPLNPDPVDLQCERGAGGGDVQGTGLPGCIAELVRISLDEQRGD